MDKKGLYLPIVEEFYSLQGEGFHTGKAAWFVRVGGCEVGCSFCDEMRTWNAAKYPMVDVDEIVARAAQKPARAVVVTGGEPMLYNMDYLCAEMHKRNIKCFLETSGSESLSGDWDWICLSPKYGAPPKPEILAKANELKVIIGSEEDFKWAEENAKRSAADACSCSSLTGTAATSSWAASSTTCSNTPSGGCRCKATNICRYFRLLG